MLIRRINNESGVITNTPIKDNAIPFCLSVKCINRVNELKDVKNFSF